MSPLHGFVDVSVVVRIGTFVKRHDDVRAEILLNLNRFLGGEAMRRAVDVTLEGHAIFVDLAGLRERKDLKATRIRQHGAMPLHEVMQAAHITDQFIAGTQIQMIRIAQNQRGVDVFEVFRRESFDRCLCAHRCKDRCDEVTMRCGKYPCAGAVVFGCNVEFKHGRDYKWKPQASPCGSFHTEINSVVESLEGLRDISST